MEEQLIALLLASPSVQQAAGNRVHMVERPQASALPGITIQRIDGIRDYSMEGANGMVASRFQIDCWGKSYSSAKATARAVATSLSGVRSPFQGAFLVDEQDSSEDATPARVFRTRLDFQIFHVEGAQQ